MRFGFHGFENIYAAFASAAMGCYPTRVKPLGLFRDIDTETQD
jgi:hypothetical protein